MSGPSLPIVPASAEASDRTKGLVRLTMACNERCPFCNVPVEDYPGSLRTATPEQVEAQLASFVEAEERTLTVSGGEPTLLRARLVALVRDARSRGIEFVELQTNAVLIDEDYARELRDAGLTSAFVSLLADEPALHDALAGLEGAFEPCLRGIDALMAQGVRVTLNPVLAASTQDRVAAYVDFVAARLAGVESISLSAVQPHGRAAKNLDLLPDYARLGPAVRAARARAREHGLRLLNPYCGLPLCVGWEADEARSVEALEAAQGRGASLEDDALGVSNTGDKSHGAPCMRCALRTRCGGAWHAYWSHRGGSGIAAPIIRRLPWDDAVEHDDAHATLRAERVDPALLVALSRSTAPTTWVVLPTLRRGEGARLIEGRALDLALELSAASVDAGLLRELREIAASSSERSPQSRVRIAAQLRCDALVDAHRAALRLARVGVMELQIVAPARGAQSAARWARVKDALALEAPGLVVDVKMVPL